MQVVASRTIGTWKRLYSDRSSEARHRRTSKIELSKNVAYIPWYTVHCAAYRLHCRNCYGQANKSILNLYVGAGTGRKGARRRRISKKNKSLHESKRTKNGKAESSLGKIKSLKNSFECLLIGFKLVNLPLVHANSPALMIRDDLKSWDNEIKGKNNKIVRRVTSAGATANLSRHLWNLFLQTSLFVLAEIAKGIWK